MALVDTLRKTTQDAVALASQPVVLSRPDGTEPDQEINATVTGWSDRLIAAGVVRATDLKVIVAAADLDWKPRQLDRVRLADGRLCVVEPELRRPEFAGQDVAYVMRVKT